MQKPLKTLAGLGVGGGSRSNLDNAMYTSNIEMCFLTQFCRCVRVGSLGQVVAVSSPANTQFMILQVLAVSSPKM